MLESWSSWRTSVNDGSGFQIPGVWGVLGDRGAGHRRVRLAVGLTAREYVTSPGDV